MACPHAKTIKGAVAYCNVVKKKVSTLKFPCKGDYRRCPIYVRARQQIEVEREPTQETRQQAKPQEPATKPAEEPLKPAEARKEETTGPPQPAAAKYAPIAEQASKPKETVEKPIEEKPTVEKPAAKPARIIWQPGGALCDSMVIALLLVSSKSIGTYKGGYDGLEEMLKGMETNGIFYYIAGDVDSLRVRFTYANMKVFGLSVEKDGRLICGDEALQILQPIEKRKFDVVIYSVSWDDVGPVVDKLRKHL